MCRIKRKTVPLRYRARFACLSKIGVLARTPDTSLQGQARFRENSEGRERPWRKLKLFLSEIKRSSRSASLSLCPPPPPPPPCPPDGQSFNRRLHLCIQYSLRVAAESGFRGAYVSLCGMESGCMHCFIAVNRLFKDAGQPNS